ncbi:hypothetical protein C8Q74DRAFT_1363717 [Fomes fomentarius]|nr:hypothetical protein C8Q74DRAFT_1363717 [Fomes fomentarius]
MTTTVPTIPHIALDDTLGAVFIGHFFTTVLYGITTLQAFMYYRDQYKDPGILKLSVFVLWVLDTVHVALITGAVYWYCITSFSNLVAVQRPIWPIPTMIIVSNISNSIVRVIFGYRLYRLSRHGWILPSIIVRPISPHLTSSPGAFRSCLTNSLSHPQAVLSIYIFIDGTYFSVKLLHIDSYAKISLFSWGLYAGLSVEVAADLIVAISQCLILHGFETGIRKTDHAIRLLMTYSVNTGLLTSLCAIGALISYATVPHKFIYFAFYFVLSKLYVNSVLATLNARGSLLGKKYRRRHAQSKLAFRTPTATADPHGAAGGDRTQANAAIEFTTVISADALSTDSVVETTKTKIGDEESFPYRN